MTDHQPEQPAIQLTEHEVIDVEERAQPRVPVIYEVVRRQGEEELSRPLVSLWWSGVAAGLSISFTLVAQALLHLAAPPGDFRPIIEALGYPVGFLIVILSRQQLFTENTITVVLPVMQNFTLPNIWRLLRLWFVVFCSNMAGAFVAASFYCFAPVLTPQALDTMIELSQASIGGSPEQMFYKAIPSGFLIAAMVWAIPSADTAKFHIIALLTYVIAIAGFAHIVAGSVEGFMLLLVGKVALGALIEGFTLPVLMGNIVGGTVLFALISHAQVMNEI